MNICKKHKIRFASTNVFFLFRQKKFAEHIQERIDHTDHRYAIQRTYLDIENTLEISQCRLYGYI